MKKENSRGKRSVGSRAKMATEDGSISSDLRVQLGGLAHGWRGTKAAAPGADRGWDHPN